MTLSGLFYVANADLLTDTSSVGQTVTMTPDSTYAIIVSPQSQGYKELILTEENGNVIIKSTFIIPAGRILGIVTPSIGGQASNIAEGYLTTVGTRLVLPAGTTFGMVVIRSDGTMTMVNTIITKYPSRLTIPVSSTFGLLSVTSQGLVQQIGPASFNTQYVMANSSTQAGSPYLIQSYGVLHFFKDFEVSRSAVISSSAVLAGIESLVTIIQIGAKSARHTYGSVADLSVPDKSSLAIIPFQGYGDISIREGTLQSTLMVLPGQIFAIFDANDALITNIHSGFFSTSATKMILGAGTSYGIITVGIDGQVLEIESSRTASSELEIEVALGSTVGILEVTGEDKVITSIGGASFNVRTVTYSGADGISVLGATVGILDIEGFVSTVVETIPTAYIYSINCNLNKLHQHPLDCSLFYQCFTDGEELTVFVFPCAPGLVFDEASSQCLTASEAVCSQKAPSHSTLHNSTLAPGLEISSTFKITCTGEQLRYPLDCNSYYSCTTDGAAESILVSRCPVGMVFDEPTSQCKLAAETSVCTEASNRQTPSVSFQLKTDAAIAGRTAVYETFLNTGSPKTLGTTGTPKTSGTAGTPRTPGTAVTSGTIATVGKPITSVTIGTAGTPGTPGTPGTLRTVGISGTSGTPGTLGISVRPAIRGTLEKSGTLRTRVGITNTKTVNVKSGSRNTISIQQQLPSIRQVKTQTVKLSSTKPREFISVKIGNQAVTGSSIYGTRIVPRIRSFSV